MIAFPQNNDAGARPITLPSWLISVAFHLVMVLLLGWVLRIEPRGTAEEPGREVGIVLKHMTTDGEYFEGETDQDQAVDTAEANPSDVLAALPADAPQFDPSDALPEAPPIIGPGALEGGGVANAGESTQGGAQPRALSGGKARVQVYNLQGEGRKFIYVFDRSVSMAGAPLASAKAQLLASLESLESTHQFQIIFFNHDRRVFDLSGGQKRIPFADDRTKALAGRFVGGITADGGTDRYGALSLAVAMRPDVIFFLTDVDDPMSAGEVEQVRRKNRDVASINAIEFGFGPPPGGGNFLKHLAAENHGGYVYVDTSKLGR